MTASIARPEEVLSGLVNACDPTTLLVCGDRARMLGESWRKTHARTVLLELDAERPNDGFPLSHAVDLALITDSLDNLPQVEGALLLGQLRNFGTHQIAVLVADPDSWKFRDFIGLGFKRLQHFDGSPPQTLYVYNIANYNHKRDWNNARYWANPEMWDKARW
ncbi:MAG: DUF6231 family protein [Marinobacter sp.]|uniref:DUF6231 family protein n=1 Tax=Marinobacter sp. TaxID=50741 RepID=UPI0034A03B9B